MKKSKYELWAYGCIGVGIVCFIFYGIGLFISDYSVLGLIIDKDIERTAQVGDFFGGVVGSIWTLAGVLLYFSALKMQSQEIANQIKEMGDNRKLMGQQQFESTFFNLLQAQQNLKNSINETFVSILIHNDDFQYEKEIVAGGDFFISARREIVMLYQMFKNPTYTSWNEQQIRENLYEYWHSEEKEPPEIQEKEDSKYHNNIKYSYIAARYRIKRNSYEKLKADNNEKELCAYLYLRFYYHYENSIGHYCRHLYNIVKFLDSYGVELKNEAQNITDSRIRTRELDAIDEKIKFYLAFIHSSLSTTEMVVLFYNCLLFEKAATLFAKYDLFENLRKESLIKPEHSLLIDGIKLKSKQAFSDRILELAKE